MSRYYDDDYYYDDRPPEDRPPDDRPPRRPPDDDRRRRRGGRGGGPGPNQEVRESRNTGICIAHLVSVVLIVAAFLCGLLVILNYAGDLGLSISSEVTLYDMLKIDDDTYFVYGIIIIVLMAVGALFTLIEVSKGFKNVRKKSIHYLSFLTGIVLVAAAVMCYMVRDFYIDALVESTELTESVLESSITIGDGYYWLFGVTLASGIWEFLIGIYAASKKSRRGRR